MIRLFAILIVLASWHLSILHAEEFPTVPQDAEVIVSHVSRAPDGTRRITGQAQHDVALDDYVRQLESLSSTAAVHLEAREVQSDGSIRFELRTRSIWWNQVTEMASDAPTFDLRTGFSSEASSERRRIGNELIQQIQIGSGLRYSRETPDWIFELIEIPNSTVGVFVASRNISGGEAPIYAGSFMIVLDGSRNFAATAVRLLEKNILSAFRAGFPAEREGP